MRHWLLCFISALTFSPFAAASYRLYKLKVFYFNTAGKKDRIEVKYSSLDPAQFIAFNSGGSGVEVQMLDTWFCPGDTSRKDYCPKPVVKKTSGALETLPYQLQPVVP